jgi:spore coat protein U-like protein
MKANRRNELEARQVGWGAFGFRGFGLLVVALALTSAASASAQTCRNLSTTPISFGSYNVFSSAPLDASGTITYRCSHRLAPVISLSTGISGTYNPRQMAGSGTLQYNLYLDAARTTIWGNGTGGTSVLNAPSGRSRTVSVYGRIFPLQDAAVGSYSDTVAVTINF